MSYQSKTTGISDQDYQSLVHDFNATDDIPLLGSRLNRLYEKVVNSFQDNIALIHNEVEIFFKEINASANILARSLAKRGLKHGDVVDLAVSRSIDLLVVMLAVLKLGAAYVPIRNSDTARTAQTEKLRLHNESRIGKENRLSDIIEFLCLKHKYIANIVSLIFIQNFKYDKNVIEKHCEQISGWGGRRLLHIASYLRRRDMRHVNLFL